MRSTLRFLVAVTLLSSGLSAARATPAPRELGDGRSFLHATLDNGLEVSVLSDPRLELVATQVWYHVGSADEDEGSRGLAHLFEHLMFGPTEQYEKDAVFQFHNRHGGDNNAYTSYDETVYVSEIAPPFHLEVLSMEAARMRGLRLTQEELENEQRIVTEELRVSTENDPFARVMVAAAKTILGDHPYALTPVGTKEDLAAVNLEACKRFYERFYHPANAHVVVAGPIDPLETLEAVRERFAALAPNEVDRRTIPSLLDWSFPAETVLSEDLPPVETAIAFFSVPPEDHPDAVALRLLRSMVGGAANPFRDDLVQKRGKALEAGLEIFWNRRGGAVGFYAAQLPYRRKTTAFRQIERSLAVVSDSLTQERLDAAKREHLMGRAWGRYWAARQAGDLGRARWTLGDVTLAELQRVWRTYFEEAEPIRLYMRPERVPIAIRLFGWLYPVFN